MGKSPRGSRALFAVVLAYWQALQVALMSDEDDYVEMTDDSIDIMQLKGIKMFHWNIRSIFPKLDEVTHILSNYSPELAIFSESWLKPEVDSLALTQDGYKIMRLDRSQNMNKKRGGLICYAKERLNIVQLENVRVQQT